MIIIALFFCLNMRPDGLLAGTGVPGIDIDWEARWIWNGGTPQSRNFQLNMRKAFHAAEPEKALLHVSADSRYRLYINERWIGDGPTRSFPQHQQFDTYDITAYLNTGTNVIAATVHHYGEDTFHYILGKGGFLCQLELSYPGGEKRIYATDSSWKVAEQAAHERRAARISCQMPFEEQFDARLEDFGWKSADFDDSGWENACIVGPVGVFPWTGMEERTIPFLSRVERYPTRILGTRFVEPVSNIAGFNVRPSLTPGATHANHNFFHGFLCMEIESPVEQQAVFPIVNTMNAGQPYLNGERLPRPRWEEASVTLRKGSNLFMIELNGREHYIDAAVAVDVKTPVKLRAPLGYAGTWLVIGPYKADETSQMGRVRRAGSVEDLRSFSDRFTSPDLMDEHARDIFNITLTQKTIPGTPDIENPAGMLEDNGNFTVFNPSEHGVEVLLDFGEELVGYSEFELDAPEGVIVDFNCFEAINDGKIQWTMGNRSSFRYVTRRGNQSFTTMWRRGFRYATMTLRNVTRPVRIRVVRTIMSTYPAAERGQFQSSDALLNEIWKVGRHTLLCCMEDTYTDCPTYEQTYWVGDGRNEALINTAAYGSWDLTARCVRLPAQSLYRSPLTESQVPSGWQNILTAWSLLWVQMAWEHYLYTGDRETLEYIYPGMRQMLNNIGLMCRNKWGLFSIDAWNMFDWAHTDTEHKINAQNNFFLVGALDDAISMGQALGRMEDVNTWREFRERIIRNANEHLWSSELESYIDSIHDDGTKSTAISQQANTLALLYNCAPEDRAQVIRRYLVAPPDNMVTFGSPFAMFYLLEALAQDGKYGDILDIVRDRWGYMLAAGATSFWETFPGYEKGVPTRSHCHAWSAAPTYFLTRYQLGAAPLAPGFSKALIAPRPVDLAWAKGKVPTPRGEISVDWNKTEKAFVLKTELPAGIPGDIRIPVSPSEFPKLYLNGKPFTGAIPAETTSITKESDAWRISVSGGQTIHIRAEKN